jgi:hypothetical protein
MFDYFLAKFLKIPVIIEVFAWKLVAKSFRVADFLAFRLSRAFSRVFLAVGRGHS